jgi:imidazolonepropionase-like amidohydrolase
MNRRHPRSRRRALSGVAGTTAIAAAALLLFSGDSAAAAALGAAQGSADVVLRGSNRSMEPAATGARPPAEVVAITGATVHTLGAAGTLKNATVLIAGGRITAVGAGIPIPAGARRIDATDKIVTPGLFDSYTHLGLVEVNAVEQTEDATNQDPSLSAAFRVDGAINYESMLIPINRVEGLTRALAAPSAGKTIFEGQAAVIHLGAGPALVVRAAAAQFVALGEAGSDLAGGTRGGAMHQLRQALHDALDHDANRAAYDHAQHRAYALPAADLEALLPVARGQMPLVVEVNRASDIEAVLALGREMKLKLVLLGAAEGWKVAPDIAAAQVPVLVNPLSNLPQAFESLGATLENAARLARAGVTIAMMTGDSHNARNLRQGAGNAVAYGLPWETALAAMTVNPARIWGVDDYGTLEAGKDADVVIWDGDPLEVTSAAERVFIRGIEMPADSRQLRLRDRYLRRAGLRPPQPQPK